MPTLLVAKSDSLQAWASDVGLTKHVYKLDLSPDDDAEAAVATLNELRCAARNDWKLVGAETTAEMDAGAVLGRVARKETMVDPSFYPQLRKAQGIFKVKLANVENHFMVRAALAGQQTKNVKLTPAQIASYLLRLASA